MQQEKEKIKEQYESNIRSKQKGYEVTVKIISTAIQRMMDSAVISGDANVCGRLKSFKSAYENISKGKKLDDCFGIRIIAGTEKELEEIRNTLNAVMSVEKSKNHKTNSATKYDALHQMARVNPEIAKANNMDLNDFPVVEIQYWTRAIEHDCVDGELAYSRYKKRDMKKIWDAYNKFPEKVLELLPTFYEASEGKIYKLSPEQALSKMYPEIEKYKKLETKKDVEDPGEAAL